MERELVVLHWREWPANFTREVWGPVSSVGHDPLGRGWQLSTTGNMVNVGQNYMLNTWGENPHASTSPGPDGARIDVALLHLDVTLKARANLHSPFRHNRGICGRRP